jgi:hypothetical protein
MKELLKEIELDKVYFGCEIFNKIDSHMKNHPNYSHKILNGLNGYIYSVNKTWGKNNKCFFIIDNNSNLIAISYNFSKSENLEKSESLKAFRTCIDDEIFRFKSKFEKNKTRCGITNEIIGDFENCHVDHFNYDFKDVVSMFLTKYNKTFKDIYAYVIELDTKRYFNNENLIKAFIKFHNENTHLRFTTAKANLTRNKK